MKELALNHLPELAPRTVESLNLLRLRLEQTAPDAKIILLTSTTPQEGKTTLALQFWQLLAGLGQRCLLVDGDLRHSGICRQCGLTSEHKVPGLAHYLSGSVPLEEVLYHTEIRGTCLVPASGTTSRPALADGNLYRAFAGGIHRGAVSSAVPVTSPVSVRRPRRMVAS